MNSVRICQEAELILQICVCMYVEFVVYGLSLYRSSLKVVKNSNIQKYQRQNQGEKIFGLL